MKFFGLEPLGSRRLTGFFFEPLLNNVKCIDDYMTEVKAKANPLLDQPLEIRLFLEGKMREDLSNKEILALLNQKFPFVNGITSQNVAAYRKRFVPNYQEMILQKYGKQAQKNPEELEDEILKEIREAEASGEEFTKEEQRKINMLHAHRTILKEYWENYRIVKPTKDETAKKNYLDSMVKVLAAIKELESSERSFLSAMDSIRKAEQTMDLEKYMDSIRGWWVPRCMEKAPSKEQALLAIDSLKTFLDEYKQVVVNSANCAAANLVVLEKLYVSQKLKIEEKEE